MTISHLELGHYAAYVWPAYGASVVVIAALVGETVLRARRWRKAAEAKPAERAREP